MGWFPTGGSSALDGSVIALAGDARGQLSARLTPDPSGSWQVDGDGIELTLAGVGGPDDGGAADSGEADVLVWAEGRLDLAGAREIDCLGWRTTHQELLEGDWHSLHQAAAWFAEDDGLSLMALHPRASGTRAEAVITAQVLGAGAAQAEDPRLSSTYLADGQVLRAGMELWLAHGEDELYPLRAAGEAIGHVAWQQAGVALEAEPFRWYSRGREGGGVYLLARR